MKYFAVDLPQLTAEGRQAVKNHVGKLEDEVSRIKHCSHGKLELLTGESTPYVRCAYCKYEWRE